MKEILKKRKPDANMDPIKKKAKMGVLKEISDMAGGAMSDDLKGLKKVTVAAPDKAGLSMGLKKAEDMLQDNGDHNTKAAAEDAEEEVENHDFSGDQGGKGDADKATATGGPADELKDSVESCDMSPQDIEDLMKILESKKKEKQPGKY